MSDNPVQKTTPKPLLMDHPLNKDHCCLECDAVFAFGDLVGNSFPPRCPECGDQRTCSVQRRVLMEALANGQ